MAIERIERVSGFSPIDPAYIEPRDERVHEAEPTRLQYELPKYIGKYKNKKVELENETQMQNPKLDVRV